MESYDHLQFCLSNSDDETRWTEIFTYLIPLKILMGDQISENEFNAFEQY